MSFTHPNPIDAIALKFGCAHCGAAPDEWCSTISHVRASYLHSWRVTPIHEAWSTGYLDYERAIAEMSATDVIDWHARLQRVKEVG